MMKGNVSSEKGEVSKEKISCEEKERSPMWKRKYLVRKRNVSREEEKVS